MSYIKDNKKFIEKPFKEVEGGYYEEGFYYTPDGSKNYYIIYKS